MVDTFENSSLCSKSSEWSREQDKAFETAIALYCEDEDQERWQKIADSVPGKNVMEVEQHFHVLMDDIKQIEAGIIPLPPYPHQQSDSSKARCKVDQERKKGIAWSEDEHMAFLRGLEQFGKGDWRSISRNCVITRTPTQVASHAQKYFMRQSSAGKEKKRNSIHDITSSKNKNSSKSSSISYSISHDTLLTTPQEQFINNSSYPHGFVPRNELEGYVPFMSQQVYISDVSSFGVRPMTMPSSVAVNQAQNVSASQPNRVPLSKPLSGKP